MNERSTDQYTRHRTAEIAVPGERNLSILIAEDNETISRYLQSILRRHLYPCEMHFANNGYKVLELVNGIHFDILLIDNTLKGMSGEELTSALRSAKNETPIILLALSEIKIPFEAMVGLGVDGIVYKPIVINELMTEIEAILKVNPAERGTTSKFHIAIEEPRM